MPRARGIGRPHSTDPDILETLDLAPQFGDIDRFHVVDQRVDRGAKPRDACTGV
jgi:hypothetical protein